MFVKCRGHISEQVHYKFGRHGFGLFTGVHRAAKAGDGVLGVTRQHRFYGCLRGIGIAGLRLAFCQIEPAIKKLWIVINRRTQAGKRLDAAHLPHQQQTQAVMRIAKSGMHCDCLAVTPLSTG